MSLNPPMHYTDDEHLKSRQRLWEAEEPRFDLIGWVLGIARFDPTNDRRVLDVGCGNGSYLSGLRGTGVRAIGCDLSLGMLHAARPHPTLANADVVALPFATATFDLVLAPHMLYHVDEREQAAGELRRVTKPGGRCVVITNGASHTGSLRSLLESAVRQATPGWEWHSPSTHVFSLENGADVLTSAFDEVEVVRPPAGATVSLTEPSRAADYVASIAEFYEHETIRPWDDIVDEVRRAVQLEIDQNGSFTVMGDTGAFVCR